MCQEQVAVKDKPESSGSEFEMPLKNLLSLAEAAEILGVSVERAQKLVDDEFLPSFNIEGVVRFAREHTELLREWMEANNGDVLGGPYPGWLVQRKLARSDWDGTHYQIITEAMDGWEENVGDHALVDEPWPERLLVEGQTVVVTRWSLDDNGNREAILSTRLDKWCKRVADRLGKAGREHVTARPTYFLGRDVYREDKKIDAPGQGADTD